MNQTRRMKQEMTVNYRGHRLSSRIKFAESVRANRFLIDASD